MPEYLYLNTTPCNESCCQVGKANYSKYGKLEAKEYKRMLEDLYSDNLDLVQFAIRLWPHDFGSYYDVIVLYYSGEEGEGIAYDIEDNCPTTWPEGYGPGFGYLKWDENVSAAEYAVCCGHSVPNF